VTWVEIPRLATHALPDKARDGYYWDGATLHVLTRHATIFGLFRSLTGAISAKLRAGKTSAALLVTTSAASRATIKLRSGSRVLGSWSGTVSGRKTIRVALSHPLTRGARIIATLLLAHGPQQVK